MRIIRTILIALAVGALVAPALAQFAPQQPLAIAPDGVTSISFGTLGAQVLTWVTAAFATVLGTVGTAWIMKGLKLAGVQVTDQMKEQLQKVVVNGLNAAAANVGSNIQGKASLELKNRIVADAVTYTQNHASDTIKALGLDPQSGEAVQAIKARIETAINDPNTPTPPSITPAEVMPKVAAPAS